MLVRRARTAPETLGIFVFMENEIWKPIEGFEGYEVSNLAKVRSLERYVKSGNHLRYIPPKIKKQRLDGYGYYKVALCKNNITYNVAVHILVAKAFIPNPDNKPCIDHINTIRTDNRIENLRWVTHHENTHNPLTLRHINEACATKECIEKQIATKTSINSASAPHIVYQYTKDDVFVSKYRSISDAARAIVDGTRAGSSNICRVIDDPKKSAYGYKWFSKRIEPTQ